MEFNSVIEKFNPYHDKRGRFTTADGANLVTVFTRDPAKNYLVERFREKNGIPAGEKKKSVEPVDWNECDIFNPFGRDLNNIYEMHERCKEVFGDIFKKAKELNELSKNSVYSDRGNIAAYEIDEMVGNNGRPKVIAHGEFESLIDSGSPEFYRGFDHKTKGDHIVKSGAEKVLEFMDGDHFVGYGIYGSGIYASKTTADPITGKATAISYGNSNGDAKDNVLRLTPAKDAVIADGRAFADEYYAFHHRINEIQKKEGKNTARMPEMERQTLEDLTELKNLLSDPGIYASVRGYDGYGVEGSSDYYVFVNRGSLVVDEQVISSSENS